MTLLLNYYKILISALLCFSLLSCSLFPHSRYYEIEKSANDTKEYRYVVLANGLRVLLVKDDQLKRAAVSMDVNSGSNHDPKHAQGLAHFLEHMLFLGTKKYPTPSAFDFFIKSHGGVANAYTDAEHTNYFFEIDQAALAPALDQFAQFFISPLLDEQYINKEINAVDAEFSAAEKNDNWRKQSVLKAIINQDHPFSYFSAGNKQSLQHDHITADLKQFFKNHYVAKNMTLAVLSGYDLDKVENWVNQSFNHISRAQAKKNAIDVPFFTPGQLPKWVNVQPEKILKELTLTFPMPNFSQHYQSKPLYILGHILGYEGRGSLYAYLKRQDWIETLVSGQSLSLDGVDLFAVTFALTDKGLLNQQELIQTFFETVEVVRQAGLTETLYQDLSTMTQLEFDFPIEMKPIQLITRLTRDMHTYSPNALLQGPLLLTQYDEKRFEQALAFIRPDNVLVSLVAPGFTAVDFTEYYEVPFTQSAIPPVMLRNWQKPQFNSSIMMPQPNPFIPAQLVNPKKSEIAIDYPERIIDEPAFELWYKPIEHFVSPRASAIFSFYITPEIPDINYDVAISLYIALANESLEEVTYDASLAGLGFKIMHQYNGLVFRLGGFNEKSLKLAQITVQRLRNMQFDQVAFDAMKQRMLKNMGNLYLAPPFKRVMADFQREVRPQLWSEEALFKALEKMTLKQMNKIVRSFYQQTGMISLVNGAMSKQDAIALARVMQSMTDNRKKVELTPITVTKVNQPHYEFVQSAFEDKGYLYYWQASNHSIHDEMTWMVLGKLLESYFFAKLRTEMQLGYVVFAQYYPVMKVPGIVFVVQSPTASVATIYNANKDFLIEVFNKESSLLTAEIFNKIKLALIKQLSIPANTIYEETNRYWDSLNSGYEFSRRENMIKALENLDFEGFLNAVQLVYDELPTRSLILGTEEKPDLPAFMFENNLEPSEQQYYIFKRQIPAR